MLRIHRRRQAKTLDLVHHSLKILDAGAASPKMLCWWIYPFKLIQLLTRGITKKKKFKVQFELNHDI
jgi:hypothetical protein